MGGVAVRPYPIYGIYLQKAGESVLDAVAHLTKEVLGIQVDHGQVAPLHGLDPLVRLRGVRASEKASE